MADRPRVELSWSGWGDAEQPTDLSQTILELVRNALGVRAPTPAPAEISDVPLRPIRLAADVSAKLASIVGGRYVRDDHGARARHALGKSTPELLLLRAGAEIPAPDAIVCPASHDQVLAILRLCSAEQVAVVPFGGGTSVVGGLTPDGDNFAGAIALDLRRMNALVELDEQSLTATFGPGLRGPEAEALLGPAGYTIGHFPQSFEFATLGGFAATRSSGQTSAGYGRFDDLVLALKVATPAGTLALGRAPSSAAGPDLRRLMLGSEGAFGVITELTLRLRPIPEARVYEGWRIDDFDRGLGVIRALAQRGEVASVVRLSDEAETAVGLARPGELGESPADGCVMIIGYEGSAEEVARRQAIGARTLLDVGATEVTGAGDAWERDRYRGPYLRDALLDAGALVETVETATFWSSVRPLYVAVGDALVRALTDQGTPPVILCHVSHVYPSGASLYFTIACAQLADPVAQWHRAKRAANDAIVAAGGSITHHHGIGHDHREWLVSEDGELGISLLRAVKEKLDPSGILNPGILITS